MKPKSVLLIMADDWSPIAKCYGNEVIHTPNIDSVAERGVVFDHAFCSSPSCAVSRACILTGLHSHTHGQYGHCHGIHGFRTHEHVQTLPKILNEHGVTTGLIGKRHVAPDPVYPFQFYAPDFDMEQMGEAAGEFLRGAQDKPFYLHVAPIEPHRMGPDDPRGSKGYGNEKYSGHPSERVYDPAEVIVPGFLPDTQGVREDIAAYYGAITRYDYIIGMMLRAVQEAGRQDDTLVIITTDHGMPFPGAKATFFDSGHHCPFIIFDPSRSKGGYHHQALMNWTDILPTVHEYLNAPLPENLAGRSLLPILDDPQVGDWDETYFSHNFHEVTNYNPYRVLRGRRYKFVHNLAHEISQPIPSDLFRSLSWTSIRNEGQTMMGQRPVETFLRHDEEALYDIQEDPFETTNLIHHPKLKTVADQMRHKLRQFRIRTSDPWLECDVQRGHLSDMEKYPG